ncbi:MAG: cytochrome c biogenesis protein CcdA [Elusimicrobia bacterium]|nr:cytochrome c biogenesis protein CcdA [Elusimicrobiota bacterium]
MSELGMSMAFIAGLASFLSPCVLPLVPGYVSFMSGLSLEELTGAAERARVARRAGLGSIFFVLGFSLVFTALGASASGIGRLLEAYMPVLSKVAGALIVVFGLHMMGLFQIRWLLYEKRLAFGRFAPGPAGAILMGMAFAFGWTPCIGPILTGILALAAKQETVGQGMGLLFTYSMGLGIPFILTGFATAGFMRFFARCKRYVRWGEVFAGALLVLIGTLIFSSRLTALIGYFPKWLFRFAL